MIQRVSTEIAGQTLSLETGLMALQADGAVVVRYGETVVLCTAMMSEKVDPKADFFPLTMEYQERYYAAGKIKGSRFIKRDGRSTDEAVLKARLMDRPIRPLFPKGFTHEVQGIATVFSADLINEPGVLALTGISAAMLIAGMPFDGPLAGVRVGMVDGQFIILPTYEQTAAGDLDLIVAGTADAITMVEAGAKEIDQETMLKALEAGHAAIKQLCALQLELKAKVNPTPREFTPVVANEAAQDLLKTFVTKADLDTIEGMTKHDIKERIKALKAKVLEHFAPQIEAAEVSEGDVLNALQKLMDENLRDNILTEGRRIDGRKLEDVRPVSSAVDILPRTHGSALFQRGETQVLSLTTLGGPGDAQIIDSMDIDEQKRYIHYYNFPPFSVGEIKGLRSPSRREVGHGALAERALLAVLPTKEEFPYTMMVVSEVVSCNGSSSMGSVCGSTMSLMAAGVPIKRPVSAIAMGLVVDKEFKKTGKGDYRILTDIQGFEDFAGDMDFKVAGTTKGITALQMDIKVKGITIDMMRDALAKAEVGQAYIMEKMLEALATPRTELSKYAPLILNMMINPDFIRDVIGKGGETIQKITAECNVEIDIEQTGQVTITAPNQESGQKAVDWIKNLTYEPQQGDVFDGTVVNILDFGAFVEFVPGRDGLVHVSELRPFRVDNVNDVVKVGDKVKVKILKVDEKGRVNLTMKEFYTGPMPGQKPGAHEAPKGPQDNGPVDSYGF